MQRISTVALTFAVAFMAVSCHKKDNSQNINDSDVFGGPMVINSVSEGIEVLMTKTDMAYKYDILWSTGDKILVRDGDGGNTPFSLTSGAGTTKGIFSSATRISGKGGIEGA